MDEDIYDMDDAALEEAFKAAKAELASTQTDQVTDEVVEPDTETETEGDAELDISDDTTTEEDGEEGTESDSTEEDGESDSTDEDTAAEDEGKTDSEDDTSKAPVVHKFKANGKEFEVTDEEMREQFPRVFGQAMDYTKKLQALKPWRTTIDALEQASMSHADVNLMIDILKGDKNAISEVLKRTGVDPLDLSTDKEQLYVPNNYGRDESTLSLKDVVDSIRVDEEFRVTERIFTTEWDDKSWDVLRESPEKIRLLHNDVKSGLYDKLAPIAEKLKLFDGGKLSDLDYYASAGREYFSRLNKDQTLQREQADAAKKAADANKEKERLAKVRNAENKRNADRSAAEQRRAAAPSAPSRAKPGAGVDYLNSSDEDFEEWYKKLEERG